MGRESTEWRGGKGRERGVEGDTEMCPAHMPAPTGNVNIMQWKHVPIKEFFKK